MKKFLFFVFSFILFASLICVSAFAYEPVDGLSRSPSVRSVPSDSVGYPYDFVFKDSVELVTGSSLDSSLQFLSGGISYYGIYFSNGSMSYYTDSSRQHYVRVYMDGSFVSDGYRYLSIPSMTSIGDSTRSFLNHNEYFPVSPLVSPVISFVGSVLSFVVSNTSILALIGLSIAFSIIPFAVGKVKELIKGY